MDKKISRKDFMKGIGAGAVSVAVVGSLAGCSSNKSNVAVATAAPTYPFEWHELDTTKAQDRAYKAFYNLGGCARSVFDSIVGQLADDYGYPYNQIPSQMYHNGHAGYTAGSLCGTLGGATGVIGLFVDTDKQDEVVKKLESWYSTTQLPIYQPENTIVQTVGNSVDCKDSLGVWMTAANVTDRKDPLRQSRCAGLCADVAKKTIELINVYKGLATEEETTTETTLADNEYIGTGKGMNGDVKVKVTMDGGKISKVEVIEQSETTGIGDKAISALPEKFVGMASSDEVDGVDVVTGSTITSNAIKDAIKDALSQVK